MESVKVLPFLCLILVCVLHLSNGQCPPNEELVDCRNDCNTCELQGFCYECSAVACDCIPGYTRDTLGVCIPKSVCPLRDDGDVLVAESSRCRYCHRNCRRRGYRGGRCFRGHCRCY
ncbi:hypothetical protein AVEN_217381-1 [Araneus ventricosus]|uniref:TIL domain-containing protein n=1 Tax=Araneus ventricosus TaxID=182803 RepID=A0A4Y2HWF7_ARAVE|nr:hypothetical protein AVEN_217381-1 [Araneus ventricosus]